MPVSHHRWVFARRNLLWCALLLPLLGQGAEVEAPTLRHGAWKLKKTVNQRPYDSRQCMHPWEDLLRRQAQLRDSGCTHEAIRKAENQWQVSSRCQKTNSEGRRWESDTLTVMTVSSDTAYRLDVTGTTNTVPLRESIEAHWTGPCTETPR